MKTNIVIKKVWEDDFSAEFNVKFQSMFNDESFAVSGNFYLSSDEVFKNLSTALSSGTGSVVFHGFENNFCELIVSKNSRGLRNIEYHLCVKEQNNDIANDIDITVNTGYIVEPASVDRMVDKLSLFYSAEEGTEINLID